MAISGYFRLAGEAGSIAPMKRLLVLALLTWCLVSAARAETVSQTFANADSYVGETRDGVFHGQGTYTWGMGNKYVGEFENGKMHGQGTFTFDSGDEYVGQMKEGKFHGQGTYTWSGGLKFTGEWVENHKWNGTVYSQFGTVTGTFAKGKWHSAL
jgi:hypothetical protein